MVATAILRLRLVRFFLCRRNDSAARAIASAVLSAVAALRSSSALAFVSDSRLEAAAFLSGERPIGSLSKLRSLPPCGIIRLPIKGAMWQRITVHIRFNWC